MTTSERPTADQLRIVREKYGVTGLASGKRDKPYDFMEEEKMRGLIRELLDEVDLLNADLAAWRPAAWPPKHCGDKDDPAGGVCDREVGHTGHHYDFRIMSEWADVIPCDARLTVGIVCDRPAAHGGKHRFDEWKVEWRS